MVTVTQLLLWGALLVLASKTPSVTVEPRKAGQPRLFATSHSCLACHNGLVTPSGEDVSFGSDWRASMMANAARDPYWHAAVRRELLDHPDASLAIEHECSACHMPMTRYQAKVAGGRGGVFEHLPVTRQTGGQAALATDGVSCVLCHQITPQGLGTASSFTAGFHVDTEAPMGRRVAYGPYQVEQSRKSIMQSASGFLPEAATHIQSSEFCATCHTLYTHALGPGGEVVGELPEQVPYLEWRHSDYAREQSCQACHMPSIEAEIPITSVWGPPRSGFSRHAFRGGNFFMMGLLSRFGEELGVEAPPHELDTAAHQTRENLQLRAARVSIENLAVSGDRLQVRVRLENLAGHKLPTAYPSRRAWVRFAVQDAEGKLVFESGRFKPDGSIQGNDNDQTPDGYEPHYERIDDPNQVQIYEAILADADGRVTTGLLTAVSYRKDNRLLPVGFDKTAAVEDIAVRGKARGDADFVGSGDHILYSVSVAGFRGPYTVEAELWYQSIAYRWSNNLRRYQSAETSRFISYYHDMAASSGVILAGTSQSVGIQPDPY